MTFNFLSPEFPEGYSVSILGKTNSHKTTAAIRLALQRVWRLNNKDKKVVTIFDPSTSIANSGLYTLAGFESDEEFVKFKENNNLSFVILDRVIVQSLEVMISVVDRLCLKDIPHQYIVIDDIGEYPIDDVKNLRVLREALSEAAVNINGTIFVTGRVTTPIELATGPQDSAPVDIPQCVNDFKVHYDSGTILIANPSSETPMIYVAKGPVESLGRTMELVNDRLIDVTDITHPELARLGTVRLSPGIKRHLIPREYIGILSTEAFNEPDALEVVLQRYKDRMKAKAQLQT